MIIKCPKCKTDFEIDNDLIVNQQIKFQCSECSFVWYEGNKLENQSGYAADAMAKDSTIDEKMEKNKLLYGLGVKESGVEKTDSVGKFFKFGNVMVFVLGLVLVFIIYFVFSFAYNYASSDSNNKSIFEKDKSDVDISKLYIELVKPLTLVREGANEYIIIRGFVYNPSNVVLPVPKLLIKLENKDERVLQEQEREIEVKTLNPLEKTDFMFKVFKFSGQVQRVKVDFDDMDKI